MKDNFSFENLKKIIHPLKSQFYRLKPQFYRLKHKCLFSRGSYTPTQYHATGPVCTFRMKAATGDFNREEQHGIVGYAREHHEIMS